MPRKRSPLPEWPYVPRPALARQFLQPATSFGVRALTLFAARGIGKTEFLKRDLIPYARDQGFACVYADAWEVSEGPGLAIARALELGDSAVRSGPARLADRARTLFGNRLKGAKAEVNLLGHKATLEAQFSDGGSRSDAQKDAERLLKAFEALLRKTKRQPILLVIDEAQTLAMPRFEPLVKTLRATFQSYDQRIVRLFTGSSRIGLERMFRRTRAPLFGQGGTMNAFPPLDRAFVQHICAWFAERTGGANLDESAAWRGFEGLHRSARLFRAAVEAVLIGRAGDITGACEAAQLDLLDDAVLRAKIERLTPLQREVLRIVWRQGAELYAATTLKELGKRLRATVALPQVQSALQRLERMELIYRAGHGEYCIELPELERAIEAVETGQD